MSDVDSFMPLWASPPGRTIRTRLSELGLEAPEFARRLGTSAEIANGLLDGKETITVELARELSHLIGASVEFWIARDCQYRDDLIRVETDLWLKDLPVREMTKLGWIDEQPDWASRVSECLSFFGVEDLESWRSTFEPMISGSLMRISATVPTKRLAVAAWLHQAMREAEAVHPAPWNASVVMEILDAIKRLTRHKDPRTFLPKLQNLLATAGVSLVVLRTLPGCPASGAARFLSSDHAMIVVSGRFLSDDQFWFTVVHEIGHLLLHGSEQAILDAPYSDDRDESQEERDANQFAADALLPASVRSHIPMGKLNQRDVISISLEAGVSPGIVVGQLQFEQRIDRDRMNRLKRRYKWNGSSLEMA
jgi:HTH-type transcriptional regulator / antitoxin HigA